MQNHLSPKNSIGFWTKLVQWIQLVHHWKVTAFTKYFAVKVIILWNHHGNSWFLHLLCMTFLFCHQPDNEKDLALTSKESKILTKMMKLSAQIMTTPLREITIPIGDPPCYWRSLEFVAFYQHTISWHFFWMPELIVPPWLEVLMILFFPTAPKSIFDHLCWRHLHGGCICWPVQFI